MREADEHDENSELRDQLLDAMLAEAMGGAEAPDLSGRIAFELSATTTELDSDTNDSPFAASIVPSRSRFRLIVLATAAGFLLTFLGLFVVDGGERATAVRMAVITGETDYIADEQVRHFVADDKADILLTVGDKFSTQAGGGVVLHLQPLGILTLSNHSTVEVLSMNWTQRDSSIVLASLTVGAIAGGFTWNSISGTRVEAGDSQPLVVASRADEPDPLVADLRSKIASLENRNRDLEISVQRKIAEAEAEPIVEEPKPEVADPVAIVALFEDPDFGDALTDIDWQTLGINLNEMLPMIQKLAEAIANGEEIPIDVVGEIQKRNGDLMVIAKAILDAKVPGSGLNGSFTHPSVVSNQIGAVLQAAGLGLDEAQQQSMERLRSDYAAKDSSLRRIAGTRDLGVENLLEEVEFKNDFYNAARSILSADQRGTLWNEASQGRTSLDPFDVANVLAQYAKPVRVKDAADLVGRWTRSLESKLSLDADGKRTMDGILSAYANKFGPSFWETKPGILDRKKMMSSSWIRVALSRQVEMMRQILNTVPMSASEREFFKQEIFIMVPYPR